MEDAFDGIHGWLTKPTLPKDAALGCGWVCAGVFGGWVGEGGAGSGGLLDGSLIGWGGFRFGLSRGLSRGLGNRGGNLSLFDILFVFGQERGEI